jgi:hypothetical protein
MKPLNNMITGAMDWFSLAPRQQRGLRALQILLASAILLRLFTELPFAAWLWGPRGVAGPDNGIFSTLPTTYAFLALFTLSTLAMLFNYRIRLAMALTCVLFHIWTNRLPELTDGGDNLAALLLIYMNLTMPSYAAAPPRSLRVWLHNVGIVAMWLQISVLYGAAGLAKASGQPWNSGTALYMIGQVEWFSLPIMRDAFANPFLATFVCYTTILHQVWLPVAMFSRLRTLWVLMGLAFHIGIAVFMGLVSFSLVMIGAEAFFLANREIEAVLRIWRQTTDRVRQWLGQVLSRGPLAPAAQARTILVDPADRVS